MKPYLRNLKNDIRKPRHYYKIENLNETLGKIIKWIDFIEETNPENAHRIFKKLFSFQNETFEKVIQHIKDSRDHVVGAFKNPKELLNTLNGLPHSDLVAQYPKEKIYVVHVRSQRDIEHLGGGGLWCYMGDYSCNHWPGQIIMIFDFSVPINHPQRTIVMPSDHEYYNLYNEFCDDCYSYYKYIPKGSFWNDDED